MDIGTKNKTETTLLIVARTILGGVLLLVGLNEYHHLFGLPGIGQEGVEFIETLQRTGYLYNVITFVQIACGLLLVSGLFVPLANLIVFPILANILMFHVFIAPQGIPIALLIIVCSAYIFWYYRRLFGFLVRYNARIDPNSLRTEEIRPFGKHA